ncbi:MAG: VPLPA-CTERM sorting domain-containing protein [Gammaproteobacteria bacterium]
MTSSWTSATASLWGGGFDVNWDTAGLGNPEYTSANFGDPSFGRDPVVEDGRLFNGAVGSFNGLTVGTIASISFTVIATEGDFDITPGGTDGDSGPWIDAFALELIYPDYNGATVRVVPVPATIWFLGTGLAALLGFSRRRAG